MKIRRDAARKVFGMEISRLSPDTHNLVVLGSPELPWRSFIEYSWERRREPITVFFLSNSPEFDSEVAKANELYVYKGKGRKAICFLKYSERDNAIRVGYEGKCLKYRDYVTSLKPFTNEDDTIGIRGKSIRLEDDSKKPQREYI